MYDHDNLKAIDQKYTILVVVVRNQASVNKINNYLITFNVS